MPENSALLELEQVNKHYLLPGQKENHEVLTGVSLRIQPGETAAVIGPSGSGKSTLLNMIGLLDTPTSGKLRFQEQDVMSLNETQRADIRNRQIGFIFQLHHLLPQCTVLENVLFPVLAQSKNSTENDQAYAQDLLTAAGLEKKSNHLPSQLSGGEQLRTAVVRSLINKPKLLLADEPTGSLDRHTAESIADLLLLLNETHGLAMVVVTHSESLAAKMQTQYQLQDGILVKS